ncbi:MAG TPA: DUF4396 domain-containing protein [Solirubrobacterales bacterium]|nr:DUF4396 domain-containing protein [Solirubrobacterales bacterium]
MESTTARHDQHAHHDHHHHEMPTEGRALTAVAISATLHCLTGCAIGEVAGMAIGTALGFSDWGTVALAVSLAFLFGYALTSLPLLRAGLAVGAVIPIALASDTLSIATMEVVDNAIMLTVPGAMEAGLGDIFFWGALSFALAIAFVLAVPVNRWLIGRGKGHAVVHETGIHGGPPVRAVAIATAAAFIFGSAVLIAEVADGDGGGHGGGHEAAQTTSHEEHAMREAANENGMTLRLDSDELPAGRDAELGFTVRGEDGEPLRDFDVVHAKRMHLIVVRDDLTGFQHLHPEIDGSGRWSTPIEIPEAGDYRVFAEFSSGGEDATLAGDFEVPGESQPVPLPEPSLTASAGDGYEVTLEGDIPQAGQSADVSFAVTRDDEPVQVDPYLGANGHLVALREGDLAYLHTHPTNGGAGHGGHGQAGDHAHGEGADGGTGPTIDFVTEYPSVGRYRLFLQFKHAGKVHTAAFTREVVE